MFAACKYVSIDGNFILVRLKVLSGTWIPLCNQSGWHIPNPKIFKNQISGCIFSWKIFYNEFLAWLMIRNIWYHCTSWFLESHFFSLTTHASASWQKHHHLWKAKRIGGRLLLVDSTSHSIRLLLSHQLFYCRLPICEVTSETSRATDQIGCKAIVFAGVQIEEITDRTSNIDAWAKDIENRAGQRPSNACRHRLQKEQENTYANVPRRQPNAITTIHTSLHICVYRPMCTMGKYLVFGTILEGATKGNGSAKIMGVYIVQCT